MSLRGRTLAIGAVLVIALSSGVALASSAAPTFGIPAFAAKGLQVGGVSRLNDGGALIAGSLNGKAQVPDWHPVVVRLRLDGTVDLAYGSEGIATLGLTANTRSTSLAIDPHSGDAWVGLTTDGGEGALIALNGRGARRLRFGHDAIAALGPSNVPTALAWGPGELLVASGNEPCTGCRLTLINPSSGAMIASGTLTPGVSSGGTGCVGGAITSAVLSDPQTAQLAFGGAIPCSPQIVTVAISDRGGHGSLQSTMATPLAANATAVLVSAFGSEVCVAASSPASTELGPFLSASRNVAARRAPGGRLRALVSLGHGACAALITNGENSGGVVAQAALGPQQPTRDRVPGSVEALGMFRCHAHLLVIGTRGRARRRVGVVVVIPVRRGPGAATARVAVAGRASARCR